jgi:hypothetical protein
VPGHDLGDCRGELHARGARVHDTVEVPLACGEAEHLVWRGGEHDDSHLGRGGADALQRDQEPGRRIEAGVEHEDVGRRGRQVVEQRGRVTLGTDNSEAQVVEQPRERLGEQLVLVGDDDAHTVLFSRPLEHKPPTE